MENKELIIVLDFYGQYNQLIARRVREYNVFCEILPFNTPVEKIIEKNPKGIIFTGGPASVYLDDAPKCDKRIFELGISLICFGLGLIFNKKTYYYIGLGIIIFLIFQNKITF